MISSQSVRTGDSKLAKSKSFAKVVEASRKAVNKKTDLKRNRTPHSDI